MIEFLLCIGHRALWFNKFVSFHPYSQHTCKVDRIIPTLMKKKWELREGQTNCPRAGI